MNLMKKAISAATSAALVASLLATVVAPVASAALVTGVSAIGNVPIGGTSGAVTVTLAEQTATSITHTGSVTVTLNNSATWTGTPVVSSAGSPGATASIAGAVLTININSYDNNNIENIVVTGLKVVANAAGDITAYLNGVPSSDTSLASAFVPGTTTATGVLQATLGTAAGLTVGVVLTGACDFAPTDATHGNATFSDVSDSRTITTAPASAGSGVQNVTFGVGTSVHGTTPPVTVSQTVPNCSNFAAPGYPLGVVGTGTTSLSYGADPALRVFPGETNANASHLYFQEPAAGFLTASPATTLTLTIATPGVTFSKLPTFAVNCDYTNIQFVGQVTWDSVTDTWIPATQTNCGALVSAQAAALALPSGDYQFAPPVMSSDNKSVSVTVATASTTADFTTGTQFYLADIHYDVAATVPGGTFVGVTATLNNGLFVSPTSNNNAVVYRGIAATATPTTVLIGQNNQKSGALSFTESQAGFFTAASSLSGNSTGWNMFSVCTDGPDTFDPANPPYAQVTPGTGVLVLRDGIAASTTGLVAGTPVWNPFRSITCYDWTVWTASTVASTITIGTKDMSSGALIDVPPYATPGPVNMDLWINHDAIDFSAPADAVVTVANRVFANQVAVTALSQPTMATGTGSALAGNLQIAETGNGQLKVGEEVCVEVMPAVTGGSHDVNLGQLVTAAVPIATATGGLVIDSVRLDTGRDCDGTSAASADINHVYAFHFHVLQQSTTGTGKIVISNIMYTVQTGAAAGNVLVNVYGYGQWPTLLDFQATVSNAKVGTAPKLNIAANSALGLNPTSGYTMITPKYQAVGKYVTWKFTGGTALAGQRVNILVAKHVNGAWGGPVYLKSAWADANGIVTFAWTSKTAAAINVRVQWPGSTAYAVSTSKALGAYYK
ncbi:MAG: hypothetical protein P4L86_11360 [Mycobacterium sp.]|nr:hypothetical protein [Mycobacterium sp.]